MKDETLCGRIAIMSTRIMGHREAWVKKLLRCRCLEDPEMRYCFFYNFDLWYCLDCAKKHLTIRLLDEKFLAVGGVSRRSEKGHVSGLQRSG
jgi:uncharacterized protein with von Willebrand factor type A (vWA) domain